MNRDEFIKSVVFGPAAFSAMSGSQGTENGQEGVRRLPRDKFFTVWHAGLEPAYRVRTGEVVLVEMSHGLPGLVTREGVFTEPGPDAIINPQTGPIFVDGIMKGDAIAIDILDIRVGDWGYCSGKVFELLDDHVIISPRLKLPLQPMIGGLGIAPATGSADTKTPVDTGGNMDCRDVRAGSTVVFRAQVDGVLVGMGDAHALQGDGEITGQGIETDAEALVRFRRLPEPLSDRPVIIRPEYISTIGAHKDLGEAAWQATDDMVALVCRKTGRSEDEARILVSLTGHLRINQIVDPAMGARMEVPAWVFGI